MLRNVRKGPLAAVERSAARLGIVRSALEPVKSTDRLCLKWARTGPIHCSGNRQIIDNSFRWRIEEIVRERQHQPRHNRAADHRWRLVSSSCQPGPQIFHPKTNYKVQYGGTCLEREAAAEYDRAFSHVTRYFVPFVLRAARVAPGMRVLDIAAGTGLSAEPSPRGRPDRPFAARDLQPALAAI